MKENEPDLVMEALRHASLVGLTAERARNHHAFGALQGREDFDELFPE
jgi:hypothetical protein